VIPVLSSARSTATYFETRFTPVTVTRMRTPMLDPVSVIVSPTPASAGLGGWWYSDSTASIEPSSASG
jgi:hypothetical protein